MPYSIDAPSQDIVDTPCCGPTCCDNTTTEATQVVDKTTDADIKTAVREKYARIATERGSCGCGPACCGTDDFSMIGDAYDEVEGYVADADLNLGCGLPTEHANLQPGDTVLDLGAGAGIDAFVARQIVGEEGHVFGVDMTLEMVQRARENARSLGFGNVSFYLGEIEALPFIDESVDVVISNCVLNLVPDKTAAFSEMYRVIKPGGHFCVSDIVYEGADLPESIRTSVELYVGCVAGAQQRDVYLEGIRKAGFNNIRVVKERVIDIPEAVLEEVLSPAERDAFRQSGGAIVSVTVYGEKR